HPRKTVIENEAQAVYLEKKAEEMEVNFLIDRFRSTRTIDVSAYERNREAAEAENKYVFPCKNTGRVCIFTNTGQLHTVKVMDIPFGKFRDKGVPIDNISNFNGEKETVTAAFSQTSLNLYRLIFVTALGMMKVVDGGEFDVAKRTVAATKLLEGDEVISAVVLNEQKQIVLQSREGYFLKFDVEEIPEKKKNAVGVRGMKLGEKDRIEHVFYTRSGTDSFITYKEKTLDLGKLKAAKRDGKGTKVRV
ncbi:MAG: DNA topoisomerase, partial [Lachnospiraceae bacterium]|nr:DNA topoisomerase [Lachnospiraceae bacterium]